MRKSWKALIVVALAIVAVFVLFRPRQAALDSAVPRKIGPQPDGTVLVPTNQLLSPAGHQLVFPGRPTDLVLSPDGTLLAVKNIDSIVLVRLSDRTILQTLPVPRGGQSFTGILFSKDGRQIYASDSEGRIVIAGLGPGSVMSWETPILVPGPAATPRVPGLSPTDPGKNPSSPGGMALDADRNLLWVTVSRNNTLGCIDLNERKVLREIAVGVAPYTVVLADGGKAYVSNWAGAHPQPSDATATTSGTPARVDPASGVANSGTVSVVDLEAGRETRQIAVGLHPSAMALNPDRTRLFVANANSDTVSVIDTRTDSVIETITVRHPARAFGSSPVGVLVSPDGKTLYVANGTDNAICVVDLGATVLGDGTGSSRVAGYIPAGWYPSTIVHHAKTGLLIVANIKGIGSRNPKSDRRGYNSHDHSGSLSFIPVPTREELTSRHSPMVGRNNSLHPQDAVPTGRSKPRPVPVRVGEPSLFKHVLYIIKENRTYDQVFGDLPQGDGDPSLVHFGRDVTPNHHALAEQFVLLDNFYCSGVLSADGHQWATEAFVTDYIEKSFGGFNRSYPYDGDDPMAYASTGFIWDKVLRKGLTFRNYGEFVQATITPPGTNWSAAWKQFTTGAGNIRVEANSEVATLRPYLCRSFIGFPSTIPDVWRAQEFIRELKEFEARGELPNFMIMLLPNDHTNGTRPGWPTPRAMVADNDLALGRIVDAVSHSRFWKDTAIFVTEDDPQAGLDHVDGHRTVGLVISPYTRRGEVIRTNYNQTGMLRTIELILGLEAMNRFDDSAEPMSDCFKEVADFTPYTAKPNRIPLDEMNPPLRALSGVARQWAVKSMELDLDDVDRADEDTLNRILWHSVKGYDTPYPRGR